MHNSEKWVAVAFDLNFRHAAEIFSGVSDYVQTNKLDWQLLPLNFGFEAKLMTLADSGKLDGVIGTFVSDGWVSGLTEKGIEAVNLFQFSKIDSIQSISANDAKIGKQAAEHLKAQGVRSFFFYGADGVYYTRLRKAGFQENVPVSSYQEVSHNGSLSDQLKHIKNAPKPCGVFCSSDRLARELIIEARTQGLEPGKELLIVGMDNDPTESIFAGIGITSFKLPSREIGTLAAEQLHRNFESEIRQPQTHYSSDPILAPRESSLGSGPARIAQRAANYIIENLNESTLEVEVIAKHVGVSRRTLEQAFKQQLNTSPYRMLSEQRLKRAHQQLTDTLKPIMEVGRFCGYPEAHHFSAWFKKHTGLAPKAYREAKKTT